MTYDRFYIDSLWVSGMAVPSTGGDLVVVQRSPTNVDWELVHRSSEDWPLEASPYDLTMVGPQGRFAGPAVLVRSDGLSHVFRGAGPLERP